MNILLTNDDGYNSYGILILKKLLSKYGKVVIVAPDSPRSGHSASLTLGVPIKYNKVSEDTFCSSGTPVDCVSFGLSSLNIKFDLVVSGCNDGYNISYDTMYSGTVGAALESLIFRIPSIAVSTKRGDFSQIEPHFDELWEFINKNKLLSTEYLLNVNFPENEFKGISLGKLYYRKDQNFFEKSGDGYLAYRYMDEDFKDKETDCYQVEHGIISVVPLNKSYFNESLYEEMKKKLK